MWTPFPDVRAQLAAIVEHSNDAIFGRNLDGTITTWNAAAERMFGYRTEEIVGRHSRLLLPPERLDEVRRLIAQIRSGGFVEHFETERLRKGGGRIYVSLTLSPLRDYAGRLIGFSTIARDITEQRQMRETLARREMELNDLFEEASIGLVLVSRDGLVLRSNQAFHSMLGKPANEIVAQPLKAFHSDGMLIEGLLKRLMRRETLQNFPTEFRSAEGDLRFVLVDADALWERGRFIHSRWFVRDISRRRQLECELLEISDRERRRFAHELHDGLGQQLGGISYLCNVHLQRLVERDAPEEAEAGRIFARVRKTIQQTRRLARGLSPIGEEPDGLTGALKELAAETSEVSGVRCRLDCGNPELVADNVTANHLYRIAQEAVNNAVKHARASAINISVQSRERQITLRVADNGKGIGPLSPRRKGLGLHIMQYRAGLIYGTLTLRQRRPRGTQVTCTVPLSSVYSKKELRN